MVVSLYICQIPENVTEDDLKNVFSELEGYVDTRIKQVSDKGKIAFVDFENERDANFARNILQGFKFTKQDKGIKIKFSVNSRFSHKEKALAAKANKDQRDRRNSDNFDINNIHSNMNFTGQKRHRSISRNSSSSYSYKRHNENNDKSSNNHEQEENSFLLNNSLLLSSLLNNSNNSNNITATNNLLSNPLINNLFEVLNGVNSSNKKKTKNILSLRKFDKEFDNYDTYKSNNNASNIVYVEGIPTNASEREVAHIFRPFPGYKSLRLITKEKNGQDTILCFADFESIPQSTACINTLQGYRFDKNDLVGLHCSYGVSKAKK